MNVKGPVILLGLQLVLFGSIQSLLWWGENGYHTSGVLSEQIAAQELENERLGRRNRMIALEVDALQQGGSAIEGRARMDLGMIKEGETFFILTE